MGGRRKTQVWRRGERTSSCRCRVPSHALANKIERPESDFKWYLFGELQIRELWVLRKPRGDQPSRLQHLLGKPRRLHQGLELEGEGERHRYGGVGRGPLHAEVHGLARRRQGQRV